MKTSTTSVPLSKNLVTVIKKIIIAKENTTQQCGHWRSGCKLRNQKGFGTKSRRDQWKVFLPPFQYTTDNAAMIGIVGYQTLSQQWGNNEQKR